MESQNVINLDNAPLPEGSARTGRIARLPHSIREELNRRIQNGPEGRKLVEWLNGLPETQAILSAQFGGQAISEQNLSKWRASGYRDWEKKQEALELAHAFCADDAELAGAPSLTDNLAFRAAAQLAIILRDFNPADAPEGQIESLGARCRQIYRLRRGDHDAKWLEIENKRLALQEQKFHEQAARANKADTPAPATMEDFRLIEQRDNL